MNAQNVSKAALTAFFKKHDIDVVTSRNYHVHGVELRVRRDQTWPEIDVEMVVTGNGAQTATEARAMLAIQIVKLLSEAGVQPYMVKNVDERTTYHETTTVFVAMKGTEPDPLYSRYIKVWPESIENFMLERIAKRVEEERKWKKDEADRKAAEKAAREAEELRRQNAFWMENGAVIEPFATVLDMPDHKILVFNVRGNKRDMVFLCDCRTQRSFMDGSLEWNVSCGHLDAHDDGRSDGVGSTSMHGKTISDCIVEMAIAGGGW